MKRRIKTGMMGALFSLSLLTALGGAFGDDYLGADCDSGAGPLLDFGSAPIDSSKTMELNITNQTAQEMKLVMTLSYNTCCVYSIDCSPITYLGGGQSKIVQVTYEASGLCLCEGSLYIMYSGGGCEPGTVVVTLRGEGVEAEEDLPEPVPTDIDDPETEVLDEECRGLLWAKVCECREDARNHGQFVRCVGKALREFRRERVLSGRQKGALQRWGAHSRFR